MFSGLTNQVTSWIGAAKGEPVDEEVPVPPTVTTIPEEENILLSQNPPDNLEGASIETQDDGDKKQSPTKAGGLFSGVKSQMSGWLGNASIPSMPAMPSMPSIPHIPGLRKNNAETDGEGAAKSPDQNEQQTINSGDTDRVHGDDEDKSSATEGADSGPESPQVGTPTEEQAGQIGNVTTKVTQSAKTFGSFLYSAVNKAGAKIKKTVEENHILGEFNKEQEAFTKSQTSKTDAAVLPWVGNKNESSVKEEILTLSSDRRNFVRAPPAGVDFEFNYDNVYPIALSIMTEDPALEKMRFELVPKIITEENFWRNYFYRVSLICKAGDFGNFGEGSMMGQSEEEVKKEESRIQEQNKSNVEKTQSITNSSSKKINESEFVSDKYQATENDLKEVEDGMKKLGIDTLAKQAIEQHDEQWEKDLEAELQDFEMVADDKQDENWEADVDDLLNDTTDLK